MKKEKKRCSVSKFLMFVSGAALTVAGFVVIPQLLEKCSNKNVQVLIKERRNRL